jgi:putative membrane protein insertion efficiency factor
VNVVSAFVRLLAGERVGEPVCRYHPSCSQYASDAVRKYGPVRGSLKAAWRLLRCNPWSRGGVDYA